MLFHYHIYLFEIVEISLDDNDVMFRQRTVRLLNDQLVHRLSEHRDFLFVQNAAEYAGVVRFFAKSNIGCTDMITNVFRKREWDFVIGHL